MLASTRLIRMLAIAMCTPLLACGRTWPWPGDTSSTDNGLGDEQTGDSEGDSLDTDTGDDLPETDTDGDIEPDEMGPTCREILSCLGECLAQGGTLDCLPECGDGAEPAESQAAAALMGCVVFGCVSSGTCSLETLDSPDCIACIGLGLILPQPPGCEDEASACQ